MIYAETIHYVRCDRCRNLLSIYAPNVAIAKMAAKNQGWLIADEGDWLKERHYCPVCREKINNE